MTETRTNLLNRLRQAPRRPGPTAPHAPHHEPVAPEIRLNQFTEALTTAHATVIRCQDTKIADTLAGLIQTHHLEHWACARDTELNEYLQHAAHLAGQPVSIQSPDALLAPDAKRRLFHETQAALTRARAGLAETGTLVLIPGPDEPRSFSLVPPVHVILIHKNQLVDDFSQWLENNASQLRPMPTNVLLVSGPSKTADIQQTLAYGAHGPKALFVLMTGT